MTDNATSEKLRYMFSCTYSSVPISFVSSSSLIATATCGQPFPPQLADPLYNSLNIWLTERWAPGMEPSCLPAQGPRHLAQQLGPPASLQSFHNVTQNHSESWDAIKCCTVHENIISQEVKSRRPFAKRKRRRRKCLEHKGDLFL